MVQQLGLLVAQSVKHQFLLGGEETVEEGLGDPYVFAQNINTAVDQAPVRDAPDHGVHQGLLYLFSLLIGIRLSCHKPSPPFKIQNQKIVFICIIAKLD